MPAELQELAEKNESKVGFQHAQVWQQPSFLLDTALHFLFGTFSFKKFTLKMEIRNLRGQKSIKCTICNSKNGISPEKQTSLYLLQKDNIFTVFVVIGIGICYQYNFGQTFVGAGEGRGLYGGVLASRLTRLLLTHHLRWSALCLTYCLHWLHCLHWIGCIGCTALVVLHWLHLLVLTHHPLSCTLLVALNWTFLHCVFRCLLTLASLVLTHLMICSLSNTSHMSQVD